jgi:hypothetical protein
LFNHSPIKKLPTNSFNDSEDLILHTFTKNESVNICMSKLELSDFSTPDKVAKLSDQQLNIEEFKRQIRVMLANTSGGGANTGGPTSPIDRRRRSQDGAMHQKSAGGTTNDMIGSTSCLKRR